MVKSRFKCGKCGRKFSMAAHLARHVNASHRPGRGRRLAGRKKTTVGGARLGRPPGVKRVGRPRKGVARLGGPLGSGTTRLVGDMQAFHRELVMQRDSLDSQIDGIGRAIEAMGAFAPARRGRPRRAVKVARVGRPAGAKAKRVSAAVSGARAGSLKDYIVRVLRQHTKPMSPRDLGARVVKAGFKTNAKDITKAVSNALPQLKAVRKVGFGVYQLTGRG